MRPGDPQHRGTGRREGLEVLIPAALLAAKVTIGSLWLAFALAGAVHAVRVLSARPDAVAVATTVVLTLLAARRGRESDHARS